MALGLRSLPMTNLIFGSFVNRGIRLPSAPSLRTVLLVVVAVGGDVVEPVLLAGGSRGRCGSSGDWRDAFLTALGHGLAGSVAVLAGGAQLAQRLALSNVLLLLLAFR